MDRRKLLIRAACATLGLGVGGATYPFLEARWLGLTRRSFSVQRLPRAFDGLTIAFLTDLHHGPYVPLSYIRSAVSLANGLRPDLILLGGDYVSKSPEYIDPVFAELAKLDAPLGKFGVLGNHDHWEDADATRSAMRRAGVHDLTNQGLWIKRPGARFRLGGVGDLWCDRQRLDLALDDATPDDASILLSHNPDFVELSTDPRPGLFLSGHTHGGQVRLPGYGAPIIPSSYGQKYREGLVQGPVSPVFVSRGIGTSGPPARLLCRPELVLITLRTAG